MCGGSEAGSYLRLLDVVYHSTLGLIVIKKKKKTLRKRLMAATIDGVSPKKVTSGGAS